MRTLQSAIDQSAYVVKISFTDEAGVAVVPVSAVWSLYDGVEAVVNSRADVEVSPLASTVYITLSGADTAFTTALGGDKRIFVVDSTYVSSLTAETLPSNSSFQFMVEDVVGV